MRSISSCTFCRARKKRCIASRAGAACRLCSKNGLKCDAPVRLASLDTISWPVLRCNQTVETSAHVEPLQTSLRDEIGLDIVNITLNDQKLGEELVEIYFRVVHTSQHLLFHQASFTSDHKKGSVPRFLLLGVFALAARFSSNPAFADIEPRSRAGPFLKEAIKSFNDRTRLVSIEALQGCVLLAFASFVQGDTSQDALLSCQAIRMVHLLQIPAAAKPDGLDKEIEIHLYWQVWMMDCWSSTRARLPQQLQPDPAVAKPLQDEIFDSLSVKGHADTHAHLEASRASSLWSLILPLTRWHAQVVKLNYDIAHEPALAFQFDNLVRDLAAKLERWVKSLPEDMRNTPENFNTYKSRGYGQRFAAMHIIYHHNCQLLFYQSLNKCVADADADEEAATNAGLCKAHATAMSKIMWELAVSPDIGCLWSPVNGHILVIASTIHLHTVLLEADKPEAAVARKLLEQNFVVLQQLQKYWPTTEFAFNRLRTFHKACRTSSISTTFNMDQWMARFLISYESSVEDRRLDVADLMADDADSDVEGIGTY